MLYFAITDVAVTAGNAWLAWNADPSVPTVEEQTEALFRDIGAVLRSQGHTWCDVVLVYLYLADMADYKLVNAVYGRHFSRNPPARCVHIHYNVDTGIGCVCHILCEISHANNYNCP